MDSDEFQWVIPTENPLGYLKSIVAKNKDFEVKFKSTDGRPDSFVTYAAGTPKVLHLRTKNMRPMIKFTNKSKQDVQIKTFFLAYNPPRYIPLKSPLVIKGWTPKSLKKIGYGEVTFELNISQNGRQLERGKVITNGQEKNHPHEMTLRVEFIPISGIDRRKTTMDIDILFAPDEASIEKSGPKRDFIACARCEVALDMELKEEPNKKTVYVCENCLDSM